MRKIACIFVVIVVIVIVSISAVRIGTIPLIESVIIKNNVSVVMSSVLKKTDTNDKSLSYYSDYRNYNYNNDYDFYSCVFEINNNSGHDIVNLKIVDSVGDNYRIDYNSELFCPFIIPNDFTCYVPAIISIKKGLSNDEINDVVKSIPNVVTLSFYDDKSDSLNYDFSLNKSFDIVNENFFNEEVQYHISN